MQVVDNQSVNKLLLNFRYGQFGPEMIFVNGYIFLFLYILKGEIFTTDKILYLVANVLPFSFEYKQYAIFAHVRTTYTDYYISSSSYIYFEARSSESPH